MDELGESQSLIEEGLVDSLVVVWVLPESLCADDEVSWSVSMGAMSVAAVMLDCEISKSVVIEMVWVAW